MRTGMRRICAAGSLLAVLAAFAMPATVSATPVSIVLNPVDRGHFNRSLTGFSFGLNESISHDANDTSVVIQNRILDSGPPVFSRNDFLQAGYLIFDLGAVSESIASAVLELSWSGDVLDYQANGVSSDPTLFQMSYSDSGFPLFSISKNLLNDLTNGPSYASATTPGLDALALSAAAITDINARLGGLLVIGLFGGTGGFESATLGQASLELTPVPEPSALWMLLLCLGVATTGLTRFRSDPAQNAKTS